jgi:flagellar export protein FliJ
MAKFAFRLESVLRQREQAEKRRQRELAELQAKLAALTAKLESADAQLRETTSIVRANRVGPIDTKLLAEGARFTAAVRQKAARFRSDIQAIQTEVHRAQEALIEAAKQRKVLEKLRDTQKARWMAAREKTESRAIEEVGAALTRFLGEDI